MSRTENFKMAERISFAIYFITNFFDDREPLKWKLRTLATNLVSYQLKDKSETIKEILLLFSVAKNANLVSSINHDILSKELSSLESDEKKSLEISGMHTDERTTHISAPAYYYKEVIKDRTISTKKNSRQDTIISLLRRKKEAMIKDILPLITGCSSKTIQRELMAMVKAGVLKKTGEKRWSRYSLNS